MKTRPIALLCLVLALIVAACGSDGDEGAADDGDTSTEETADTTAETTEDTTADDADGALPVALAEWTIELGDVPAGPVSFSLTNNGEFPHALAIAKGTSYDELPQLENGAVDVDALGDDYLGTSDNVDPAGTGSVDFDLEAGDYVFFCPIAVGPNSHAGAGQVLSVTVG